MHRPVPSVRECLGSDGADEATTLLAEAAEAARAVGDRWGLARALTTLTRVQAREDA
jgi:hypothetical protein